MSVEVLWPIRLDVITSCSPLLQVNVVKSISSLLSLDWMPVHHIDHWSAFHLHILIYTTLCYLGEISCIITCDPQATTETQTVGTGVLQCMCTGY